MIQLNYRDSRPIYEQVRDGLQNMKKEWDGWQR